MHLQFLLLAVAPAVAQFSAGSGPKHDSGLGCAVLTLSDIDGDGVSDFASGAPGLSVRGVARAGKVMVYSGATRAILDEWTSPFDLGFGRSLRPLDDVNGDGLADVLVGYGPSRGASRTDVRCGRSGELLRTFEVPASDLIPLGDTNADGEPDLLLTVEAAWQIVGARSGSILGTLPPRSRPSFPSRYYRVQYGTFWPVGDLDGDGVVDGVLPMSESRVEPQLLLSARSLDKDGQVILYPESQRISLGGLGAEHFPEGEPVVWKADPAGDLDADGVPDFFLGMLREYGASTLIGVSAASHEAPAILTYHAALEGGVLEEYRHFAEDLMPMGDIDDVPGDDLLCLGHPDSLRVNLYALSGAGGKPLWKLEPARTFYQPKSASFSTFDDLDGDGVGEILVGTSRYDGRFESTFAGQIQLISPTTGRVFWGLHADYSVDASRFVPGGLLHRPLLLVQGDRDSHRQLEKLDSCLLDEVIPNLVVLHLAGAQTHAFGAVRLGLPEPGSLRSTYVMGPARDGFEMVLVGDDHKLVKRYGLVMEPETILRDYRKARARWAREKVLDSEWPRAK